MGWAPVAKVRNEFLGRHYSQCPASSDCVVVDLCSESRRVGSGPREQSAQQLCQQMCRPLFRKCEKGLLVIMFDDSSMMHEQRARLHESRYKPMSHEQQQAARREGKVVMFGQAFKRGLEPYSRDFVSRMTIRTKVVWNRLWSSPYGKTRSWELLYSGIVWCHHALAKDTQSCIMWHRGPAFVWPYCREVE